MNKLIPQHRLASLRGQVLDSHIAVDALRQALNYPDDLEGFDDLLNAVGANRSNYLHASHQQKLIDAVSNGDWAIVKPRINANSSGASWNGFKPKSEPPSAQHLVEDHAFTLPKPAESGFHIVQSPMSLDALERSLYDNPPGDALRKQFRLLNRHLGEQVKPGQMVIFSDSRHYMCRREEVQMTIAAEQVNEALKNLSDEEASFMVEHHELIEPFLGISSGGLGVASFMVGRHLEDLGKTLKELERLHLEQYRQHRHLHSQEFYAQRKRLMAKLDAGFGPLVRKGLGLADHPKLKRALGLSSRKTIHHWNKAGSPTQLPGYATNIQAVSQAVKYMKVGGYVAIAMGTGSAAMKISETCRSGREEECRQVKFVEGSKLSGNVLGGIAAGRLAPIVAPATCVAIGIGTAGFAGVACMLVVSGAVVAGTADGGALLGEVSGEMLYRVTTP